MPRYRGCVYNNPNWGRYYNHPYAEDDEFDHPNNLGSSSVAIAESKRGHCQTPYRQFCRLGYHHQPRHPPTTIETQSTDPHVSNAPYRDVCDSKYNDTIREILNHATVMEKNAGNLLERLKGQRPGPDMSWIPSNGVYMLNRTRRKS